MPYCFFGSSIKFQGHMGWKIDDFNPIWIRILGGSQLSNPSDLPCWGSSFKFQGHTGIKIVEFDPDWAFPDCNSSLNSPMATKCCTKLEVAWKRFPIGFEDHPSNFKVTRLLKSSNLTQTGRFRTVTPVWIHQWLWNDAHIAWSSIGKVPFWFSRSSVKLQSRSALKIFKFDPN